MSTSRLYFLAPLVVATFMTGCVTNSPNLADGRNVRSIVLAQIEDPAAADRYGTTAPQGTDPEVLAATVSALRQRGSEGSSKPGLLQAIFGALTGK